MAALAIDSDTPPPVDDVVTSSWEAMRLGDLLLGERLAPRELVLYWRDLAPHQKIEVPVDLVCRVPGQYRGPASRAYLYYNADVKHWIEPLSVKVAAKE